MKTFELFSRPGCHLCDELAEALTPILRGRAEIRVVNIDEDIELKKRYGLRIPVLVAGDIELSEFPLDVSAVEAYLGANDADA
ncbi:MAG: glutaredoxin family protein [Gammaproteobacteria bacterium]